MVAGLNNHFYLQIKFEDSEGKWITAILLAIFFQDENVGLSYAKMHIIPSLALRIACQKEVISQFREDISPTITN